MAAFLAVAASAYFGSRYQQEHQDDLPYLDLPDVQGVGPNAQAASTDDQKGDAFFRPFEPGDLATTEISPLPVAGAEPWTVVRRGSPLPIRSLFRLGPDSMAQVSTGGGWILIMDGEGEFVFEDARINDEKNFHTAVWHVKRGSLRVSSYPQPGVQRRIEIRVPGGLRIFMTDGEFGFRTAGAAVQAWLLRGSLTVRWPDGKRKEFSEKGMVPL